MVGALASRLGLRGRVLATVLVGLAIVSVPTASAQTSGSSTVGTSAEAWYRTPGGQSLGGSPACDLPTGCGPALPPEVTSPPSPYAEGTLHVGIAGGREEARTYLTLDFTSLELGSTIVGGMLELPIDTSTEAGTLTPDLAKLQACLPNSFVRDGVDGDIVGAPEVDCSVSSAAIFVPGDDAAPPVFKIDLAPFAGEWIGLGGSLAIVAADVLPSDNWHLAFRQRDAESEVPPITAEIVVAVAGDEETPAQPADQSPPPSQSTAPRPVRGNPVAFLAPTIDREEAPSPEVAPPAGEQPPVAAPPQEQVAAPQIGFARVPGFAYPAVFLLPLVLAAAGAWVARAFTSDLATRRSS